MAAVNARCNLEVNIQRCTRTYEPCPRKGKCCECLTYHRANRQLPGCLFPPEAERTYDRSSCVPLVFPDRATDPHPFEWPTSRFGSIFILCLPGGHLFHF